MLAAVFWFVNVAIQLVMLGLLVALLVYSAVTLLRLPLTDRRTDCLKSGWCCPLVWLFLMQAATAWALHGPAFTPMATLRAVFPFLFVRSGFPERLLGALPVAFALLVLTNADAPSVFLPTAARRVAYKALLGASAAIGATSFVALTWRLWTQATPTNGHDLLFPAPGSAWDFLRGVEIGVTLFAGSFVVRLEASSVSKGVAGSLLGTALVLSVGGGDCVARLIGVASLLVLLVGVGFPLTRLRGLFGGGYGAYGCGVAVCVVMVVARSVVAGFVGEGFAVLHAMGEGLNPVSILAVCCVCGAPLRWVQFFRKQLPQAGWKPRTAAIIVCVGGTLAAVAAPFVGNPVIAARLVGCAVSTAVIPALPFWMFQQLFVVDFVLLMRPWFHVYLMFMAYVAGTMALLVQGASAGMLLRDVPFLVFLVRLPSLAYVILFSPAPVVVKYGTLWACMLTVVLYTPTVGSGVESGSPLAPLLYFLTGISSSTYFKTGKDNPLVFLIILIVLHTLVFDLQSRTDFYPASPSLFACGFLLLTVVPALALRLAAGHVVNLKPSPTSITMRDAPSEAGSLDELLRMVSARGDDAVVEAATSWGIHTPETAAECLHISIRRLQRNTARLWVAKGARVEDMGNVTHGLDLYVAARVFGLALSCNVPAAIFLEEPTLFGDHCTQPIKAVACVLAPSFDESLLRRMYSPRHQLEEALPSLLAAKMKVRRWITGAATYILPRSRGEGPDVLSIAELERDDFGVFVALLRASCWTDRVGVLDCCRAAWEQHGGRPVHTPPRTHHAVLGVDAARATEVGYMLSLRRVCRTLEVGGLVEPFGREVLGFL